MTRCGSLVLVASLALPWALHADAQQRAFVGNGWGPLTFPMSCDDATTALRRWRRAPTASEAVGMFPGPAGTTTDFTERTFVTLTWREHGREARAECADYTLKSVSFAARGFADERAANAGLAPLIARFGPPSIDAPTQFGRVHGWTNATTRLLFFVTHVGGDWMTSEEWTPISEPRSW